MRIQITLRTFDQFYVWAYQNISLGYRGSLSEECWTVETKEEAIKKLNEVYEKTKIINEELFKEGLRRIENVNI